MNSGVNTKHVYTVPLTIEKGVGICFIDEITASCVQTTGIILVITSVLRFKVMYDIYTCGLDQTCFLIVVLTANVHHVHTVQERQPVFKHTCPCNCICINNNINDQKHNPEIKQNTGLIGGPNCHSFRTIGISDIVNMIGNQACERVVY